MASGKTNGKRPLLGAHMPIAGGVAEAPLRGRSVGCECMQIFTKSARQWASKPYADEDVKTFRARQAEAGIAIVVAHDSYLLNLGAPDSRLRKRSIEGFIDELERCEMLGIPNLIAHPGSHVGSGEDAGIKTIARSIDEVHAACPGYKVRVTLELTAGQGTNLGCNFDQMRRIFDRVKRSDRMRLCIDTEHAFAAGYDLRTREGYERTFGELADLIGIDRVAAFHLNDSKKPLGSRVDRHEHIGKGHMGLEPFRRLLNDPRFAGIPMCLETPKGPDLKEDVENLATLRELFAS
ncbi:MAG TPA: deoxyribonuclease IV [Candidatus Binataceae bacterium]|nr:deoxyribonuclease IV [Candidatus Binataceae bacterium]